MTNDQQGLALDPALREEALDVLRDALRWRLTARRWTGVEEVVAGLAAALRAGDVGVLRRRVHELELSGPVRATGIDEDPVVEPPDAVRPVLNALVRALEEDESGPAPGDR